MDPKQQIFSNKKSKTIPVELLFNIFRAFNTCQEQDNNDDLDKQKNKKVSLMTSSGIIYSFVSEAIRRKNADTIEKLKKQLTDAEQQKVAAEEAKLAAELQKVAAEEAKLAAELQKVAAEEAKLVSDQEKELVLTQVDFLLAGKSLEMAYKQLHNTTLEEAENGVSVNCPDLARGLRGEGPNVFFEEKANICKRQIIHKINLFY